MSNMVFFDRLGQYMGIQKARGEEATRYTHRLMLSAAAAWMLTGVHNRSEAVSVESIRALAAEKLRGMSITLPGLGDFDIDCVTEYVYNTLLENGAFYHTAYHLRPVPRRLIHAGSVDLVRGMLPQEDVHFSGLAPYILTKGNEMDFTEAFGLTEVLPKALLEQAWNRLNDSESVNVEEYLNLDRRNGEPYYSRRRRDNVPLTLGRSASGFNQFHYYLIRGSQIRRFTDDYLEAHIHDYCRIAIMNGYMPQRAIAKIGATLTQVDLSYLLPAPELRFLRYIAWPETLHEPDRPWRFALHTALWPALKARLTFLKYTVEESHE